MRARLLLLIGLLVPLAGDAAGAAQRMTARPRAANLELVLPLPPEEWTEGFSVADTTLGALSSPLRTEAIRGNLPSRDEWLGRLTPLFRGEPSNGNDNGNGPLVPEPSTAALLMLGLLAMASRRR